MIKRIHILSLISVVNLTSFFAQNTLIPDPNFEQKLISLGYDSGTPDGSVPTANILGNALSMLPPFYGYRHASRRGF